MRALGSEYLRSCFTTKLSIDTKDDRGNLCVQSYHVFSLNTCALTFDVWNIKYVLRNWKIKTISLNRRHYKRLINLIENTKGNIVQSGNCIEEERFIDLHVITNGKSGWGVLKFKILVWNIFIQIAFLLYVESSDPYTAPW